MRHDFGLFLIVDGLEHKSSNMHKTLFERRDGEPNHLAHDVGEMDLTPTRPMKRRVSNYS